MPRVIRSLVGFACLSVVLQFASIGRAGADSLSLPNYQEGSGIVFGFTDDEPGFRLAWFGLKRRLKASYGQDAECGAGKRVLTCLGCRVYLLGQPLCNHQNLPMTSLFSEPVLRA